MTALVQKLETGEIFAARRVKGTLVAQDEIVSEISCGVWRDMPGWRELGPEDLAALELHDHPLAVRPVARGGV